MLSLFLCFSCSEIVQKAAEVSVDIASEEELSVDGNYHVLNTSHIFLPVGHKKVSIDEFAAGQIANGVATVDVENDKIQLSQMKQFGEDFFIFTDTLSNSFTTVTEIPYTPLGKQTAVMAIKMLENALNNNPKVVNITRDEAVFNRYKTKTLFKAKFHVFLAGDLETYRHLYVVSGNNKTYMIQTFTGFDANMDPFIERIKL